MNCVGANYGCYRVSRISAVLLLMLICGCAGDPYHLAGPGHIGIVGPTSPKFLKSIRCEMVTFLVINRLRANLWRERLPALRRALEDKNANYREGIAYLKKFPFIDIDATQYASIQADLKYIDNMSLSSGFDWQFIAQPDVLYQTYGVGPGLSQSRTFQSIEPIALPQYADFGPLKNFGPPNDPKLPKASKYTRLYASQPAEDEEFYCYDSFYQSESADIEDAIFDVQKLVVNDAEYHKYVRFSRIYVDGHTLAEWLQLKTIDMSSNYQTIHATYETVIPGQLVYNFTLFLKPSISVGYKAFGGLLNTLSAGAGGGIEHSSNFSIYFNTPYSQAALQAKGGNTCVGKVVDGVCRVKQITPNLLPDRVVIPSNAPQINSSSSQ